jgi:hypothetical protein
MNDGAGSRTNSLGEPHTLNVPSKISFFLSAVCFLSCCFFFFLHTSTTFVNLLPSVYNCTERTSKFLRVGLCLQGEVEGKAQHNLNTQEKSEDRGVTLTSLAEYRVIGEVGICWEGKEREPVGFSVLCKIQSSKPKESKLI